MHHTQKILTKRSFRDIFCSTRTISMFLDALQRGDWELSITSKKLKNDQAELITNNQPDLDNNTIYDYADY